MRKVGRMGWTMLHPLQHCSYGESYDFWGIGNAVFTTVRRMPKKQRTIHFQLRLSGCFARLPTNLLFPIRLRSACGDVRPNRLDQLRAVPPELPAPSTTNPEYLLLQPNP